MAQTSEPTTRHKSDSYVQRKVEELVIRQFSREEDLALLPEAIRLAGGSTVKIDGVDRKRHVLCEVYAHVGKTRGGQPAKLAKDILKLIATEKRLRGRWRKVICFTDHEAASCLQGKSWLTEVARDFGFEVRVVKVSARARSKVRAAQVLQVMVNR